MQESILLKWQLLILMVQKILSAKRLKFTWLVSYEYAINL